MADAGGGLWGHSSRGAPALGAAEGLERHLTNITVVLDSGATEEGDDEETTRDIATKKRSPTVRKGQHPVGERRYPQKKGRGGGLKS